MSNEKIIIAGSSSGGSSYTHRIIGMLKDMKPDATLTIVIGRGEKQEAVYSIVNRQVLQVYHFVAQCNGSIKTEILVERE